jgi:hypothetical protein
MAGRHVVVRNTFLEFSDDGPAIDEEQPGARRVRAQSDVTDSKLPVKVELSNTAGFYQVSRHRMASTAEEHLGSISLEAAAASGGASGAEIDAAAGLSTVLEDPSEGSFSNLHAGLAGLRNMGAMGLPGDLGWVPPGGMPPFPGGPPIWWGGYGDPSMAPFAHGDPNMPPFSQLPYAGYGGQQMWDGAYNMPQAHGNHAGGNMGRNKGKGGGQGQNQKSRLQLSEHLNNGGKGRAANSKAQAAPSAPAPQLLVSSVAPGEETTVMLRNVPNCYSRGQLLGLLNSKGFQGIYDFVYLPMDFRNGVNLGYAFVNLVGRQEAMDFTNRLQGFNEWTSDSSKVCEVSWAHPHQGLAEHVERYRNSPVMHPTMPDEYKPMVFRNGVQQVFPTPTKTIKAPKLRLTTRAEGKTD